MKFNLYLLVTLVLLTKFTSCDDKPPIDFSGNFNNDKNELKKSDSDFELEKIRNEVLTLAVDNMKSESKAKKGKANGKFGEHINKFMKNKGKESRKDKKLWGFMNDPQEVYQFCVFPTYKVNFKKWCENSYLGKPVKLNACENSFCKVCCDHMPLLLQNIAKKETIGEKLELNQNQGAMAISNSVDASIVDKCKNKCNEFYHVDLPRPKPSPKSDESLGTDKNPGRDCMDIKKWGKNDLPSGTYWIKTTKGTVQVYCDMLTDGGGWTLFFNYRHLPFNPFSLNGTILPHDLKINSHVNIDNFFPSNQNIATELRFMCSERFNHNNSFWHFKTTSNDLLKVAGTGIQEYNLKENSLMNGYNDLAQPDTFSKDFKRSVAKQEIGSFKNVGTSKTGGFYDSPFFSDLKGKYWNVMGNDITNPIFECGSKHRNASDADKVSTTMNPLAVYTHHSIFFRGPPPTPEQAFDRANGQKN